MKTLREILLSDWKESTLNQTAKEFLSTLHGVEDLTAKLAGEAWIVTGQVCYECDPPTQLRGIGATEDEAWEDALKHFLKEESLAI